MPDEAHVEQAKQALLKAAGKLNYWEIDFLSSMLHVRWPSPRQLTVLETLLWKPRAKSRRGGRTGR